MKYDISVFQRGLDELNIELSELQMNQFLTYYELLIEKNKVMNLTAITEFSDVMEKHFIDSLSITRVFRDLHNQKVLDLGTGAGFPGIPLKIVFPDLDMVLLDSLNKRIMFLNDVIEKIGLKNIIAVHGRAEEAARQKNYRQQFDLCVSRAVANLASLSEYCIPFVKPGGYFVSYKSADIDDELLKAEKAIYTMGGKIDQVSKFQLPGSDQGRSLVCILKERNTPKIYPRKPGTPAKNPVI